MFDAVWAKYDQIYFTFKKRFVGFILKNKTTNIQKNEIWEKFNLIVLYYFKLWLK